MNFLEGLNSDFVFSTDWPKPIEPEDDDRKWIGSNCMSYAFNYRKPIRSAFLSSERHDPNIVRDNVFSILGPYDKLQETIPKKEILWRFSYNAGLLGISFRIEKNAKNIDVSSDEKVIGIAWSRKYGHHFFRRDSDGRWSHKLGWDYEPEILCEANENPCEKIKKHGYKVLAILVIKQI